MANCQILRQVSCGVSQGRNLGPLLFLVYINDLPNFLSSVSPRMFADDINLTFAASAIADLEIVVTHMLCHSHTTLSFHCLKICQ